MAISFDEFVSIVRSHLAPHERANGVAYVADKPLARNTQLQLPGTLLTFPFDAYLAFIDGEPSANWGHPARYLLVSRETGEARSLDARLPPFGKGNDLRWRVVFKAPSVPDAVLPFPPQGDEQRR